MPTLETNQLLAVAVDAADSRKAEDIRILALDPAESSLTDYFLICSGTNERQNGAIADEIEIRLKREFATLPNSVEGRRQGEWILLDYVDFVVHIFMPEKRAYYGLERLRKSAKMISLDDLHGEIKAALTATRKKTPADRTAGSTAAKKTAAKKSSVTRAEAKPAASAAKSAASGTKSGSSGKTARKSSSKVSEALTPAKKSAKKSSSVTPAGAKRPASPKPQPAAKKKTSAAKKKPTNNTRWS